MFPKINIEYYAGVPDVSFFDNLKPDSLVVLDDLWSEVCKSKDMVKAFKVFSRKMRFSIIVVSQCYFGGSDGGREIRNNVDVIVLFENHGDADLNNRIMRKLGYTKAYKQGSTVFTSRPHSYIVVNCSAKLPHPSMRVGSNFFAENHPYMEFYV